MIPLSPKSYLYIAVGIAVFLLGIWLYSLPEKYRNEGRKEVHAEYAESTRIATIERKAEIERLKREQAETNRKVVTQYETQLKSLSDRLADARAIGLRVPKTICSGIASVAEATSAEGNNEDEYIRLPERIESGLFRIAQRAQEINIQLGACQSWIIQNGFYSSVLSSTPNK